MTQKNCRIELNGTLGRDYLDTMCDVWFPFSTTVSACDCCLCRLKRHRGIIRSKADCVSVGTY
jgi:hypothetical protein